MSRLPRRSPRVRPPLRGRSAAVPPLGQSQSGFAPVFRQRPAISGRFTGKQSHRIGDTEIHSSLLRLYKQWPGLFKLLDQPWKWFISLVILAILLIVIGSLL